MGEVIFWVIIAVVAIAVDLFTSSFIIMWFALGAFMAILLSLFEASFAWQVVVFLVAGIVTVCIGYPWAKKKFKAGENKVPTMEQTYIGKVMTAEEDILEISKIKVSGIYWTAYNKGQMIKKGDKFIITGIEGNKLIIKLQEE